MEFVVTILAYLGLGAFAGTLAGLFGIGGGLVIVPALVFGFQFQGVDQQVLTHLAVGTSLATIIITSMSAVRAHHKRSAVNWSVFKPLTVGMVLGALLGANTAAHIKGPVLQTVIGLFAIVIAFQMLLALAPKPSRSLPNDGTLFAAGGLFGWASAIFGIGGGSLIVPYLSWCNVKMQEAVATSSACGFPIALSGALTYVYLGWQNPSLPDYATGFVYWPAFVGITLTSVLFARFGAKLAHRLSPVMLKRIFGVLLLCVGIRFLLG
ncbi:MAG: hypothetical protein CSA50_06640 [Gammaproteobacteria bacterium]|nr:MAG: hypothetical protein CSA50_06640 [Gammaproteobacteria bacterium]